jgi:hypothetical protein
LACYFLGWKYILTRLTLSDLDEALPEDELASMPQRRILVCDYGGPVLAFRLALSKSRDIWKEK